MPSHASWKGRLKISLALVPVQAFTAAAGSQSSEIALHQLHKTCKNRIQYKKVCPIHGAVSKEEIVSGYEYAHDQYAILGKDELDALSSDMEKSLAIDCFVSADAIDLLYAAGQTYYLVPDGRLGEKPYALIRDCLAAENLHGIGEMVISRKQHLVRLRAAERLLIIDLLHYEGEVRQPARYEDEIRNTTVSAAELKLTSSLIEQMTPAQFDISQYADDYMEKMKQLIETKVKGKKLPVRHNDEEPDVVNFLDALKKSVKQTQSKSKSVRCDCQPGSAYDDSAIACGKTCFLCWSGYQQNPEKQDTGAGRQTKIREERIHRMTFSASRKVQTLQVLIVRGCLSMNKRGEEYADRPLPSFFKTRVARHFKSAIP